MSSLAKAARFAVSSSITAPLCAMALGLALVYLAGFAHSGALHDGAHDARHAANFPCH